MKKLLSFLLCFAVIFTCVFFINNPIVAEGTQAAAYESAEPVTPPESDFTYRLVPVTNPTRAAITGYSGKETKIIVPESLGGYPVTNITSTAFSENEAITFIKLPSELIGISSTCFNLCSSLTEIAIDDSNPYFAAIDGVLYRKNSDEESADYGKPETLAIFPAGKGGHFTIPYGIKTVGSSAFANCFNLTSVDMYNTVTTISSHAFSYCWNLKSIRLSDNLESLGSYALSYCNSLKFLELPSRLSSIGTDAVLGGIDSDDNKFYYFNEGIACTEKSYAYDYLIDQHLPPDIIIINKPSITDNDTGIRLVDAYNVLPKDEKIDILVEAVPLNEVEALFPIRYKTAFAFDISFTKNGEPFTPDGNVVLKFDAACKNPIPTASKIYRVAGERLISANGAVHTPFVGAQTTEGGRFIILTNTDFSLMGDIDGDGRVTLYDVKAALHSAAGTLTLTPEQISAGNIDGSKDGKITTNDARIILRLAGGMEE